MSPDQSAPGYNIIFAGWVQSRNGLHDAAALLKMSPDALEKLIATNHRLPIARTATREEAHLLSRKLSESGLETETISDDELGISEKNVIRVRSIVFTEKRCSLQAPGRPEAAELSHADLLLLVAARLLIKTTAVKERKSRGAENEILDASEFYADEFVVDVYSSSHEQTWRIAANNFDFSCLNERKALVVNENMSRLVETFASKAPSMFIDNSYNGIRQSLDLVWGSETATRSDGWRRHGPGRFTIGATTTHSNESQFTRYSRLRYYLVRHR
jgi:hypothetical protein